MKELADLLEKMDAYFEGKSNTERLALILLPAAVVAYFAWSLLNPSAVTAHEKSTAEKKHMEKKLREDKAYLKSITVNGDRDYHVKEYDKKIALAHKRADTYRSKITLLDKNLNTLSDTLFNKKSLSLFLNSITSKAHERNVAIASITNKPIDSNATFGHVLEVGLSCQGDFPGIMEFMNDLEQNKLVTDVYGSRVYTESNDTQVHADINISVWGVNR